MNIKDYPETFDQSHLPSMWGYIFQRQHELCDKYIPIEVKNGLRWSADVPLDIDDPKAQSQLKDFAWRVMEEVGESFEVLFSDPFKSPDDYLHVKEELADGLHFITEMGILLGSQNDLISFLKASNLAFNDYHSISPSNVPHYGVIRSRTVDFLIAMGVSMNCLKNKPWKVSHVLTDKPKLLRSFKNAYVNYIYILLSVMSPLEILNFYFRKSEVNKFRINSNY